MSDQPTKSSSEPEPLPRGILGHSLQLEPELFAFQREAYPERRDDWVEPRWKWMFLESAQRLDVDPMVWIYRGKKGVAAHQGAIAVRLKVDETALTTGWFVETMALESVRGKSIGPMLIQKALEDLPLNLSLGQTEGMRTIQFAMGWEQVAPLNTYFYAIHPSRVLQGKLNPLLRPLGAMALKMQQAKRSSTPAASRLSFTTTLIDQFSEEHDALWNRVRSDYRCAVVRDASYLNWKYVTQPGQDFRRVEVRSDGELVACVVVMTREPDEAYAYRRGFLVDMVAPLSEATVLHAAIDAARQTLAGMQADAIFCHAISKPLEAALAGYGFAQREATRYFLVSTKGADESVAEAMRTPDAWFITQGDSDIDRPW